MLALCACGAATLVEVFLRRHAGGIALAHSVPLARLARQFADCAKQVMQNVRVNSHKQVDAAYVARLEREVARLRAVLRWSRKEEGAALPLDAVAAADGAAPPLAGAAGAATSGADDDRSHREVARLAGVIQVSDHRRPRATRRAPMCARAGNHAGLRD